MHLSLQSTGTFPAETVRLPPVPKMGRVFYVGEVVIDHVTRVELMHSDETKMLQLVRTFHLANDQGTMSQLDVGMRRS